MNYLTSVPLLQWTGSYYVAWSISKLPTLLLSSLRCGASHGMPIPLCCFFYCNISPPLPPSHLKVLWPRTVTGESQQIRINHMQALCPQPQLLCHFYWHEPRRLPGTRPAQGAAFQESTAGEPCRLLPTLGMTSFPGAAPSQVSQTPSLPMVKGRGAQRNLHRQPMGSGQSKRE